MSYSHLTFDERREIAILRERNLGVRTIARILNRNPGTISRELNRNKVIDDSGNSQYSHLQADELYNERLHKQSSGKYTDPTLKDYIKSRLLERWSPEQISGRLTLENPNNSSMQIGFSTIYRWIRLERFDVNAKVVLRRKTQKNKPKINRVPDSKSIKERPEIASNRERVGDWELDTINSAKKDSSGLITMCDRKSRMGVMFFVKNAKSSSFVMRALNKMSDKMPFHTATTDQGAEFNCYKEAESDLGIVFYFCNPHSPWQKGAIENFNGLIREFFPKGTNFMDVTESEIIDAMELLNNRPRKCLDWKTPLEVMSENCSDKDLIFTEIDLSAELRREIEEYTRAYHSHTEST